MESRVLKPVLAVYVVLFILFLYGPFFVLGILSFQQGPEGGPQFPIIEWSTYWYRHIFGLTPPSRVAPLPLGESLFRSLTLAFMTMVTLRQSGVGAEALITGRALLAMYDWFHLGQNLMPAVNAVLLGSLLYQSRLVPRALPLLGLIGAPLLAINTVVLMFGITGPALTLTTLGVLPIAVWEFSLGVWLVAKGFNPAAIITEPAKQETNLLSSAV